MAFCSFSSQSIINNSTSISNTFINEFLPIAPEHCVKVYMFGLYNCNNVNSLDNNLESFARILNIAPEDVVSCFSYWKDMGLVQILNVTPLQVKYLPVSSGSAALMKFNKDKYKDFNQQAQELLGSHIISTTEYHEYYYLMESLHIERDAFIKIIKYCIDLKGQNVGYKYIVAVAKNWAYEGITTSEKVNERLTLQKAVDSDLSLVLKALGLNRMATVEDYELFLVWTSQLGFDVDVIVNLAKQIKTHKGGLAKLDKMLNNFYTMRLTSTKEINEYLQNEQQLYDTAKEVCKNIGVRYDNLEIVVETYVSGWYGYGFDFDTLVLISKNCFKTGIKTLEGVNNVVKQFYKLGLVSVQSVENHLEQTGKLDNTITGILSKLGIIRNVNKFDRDYYNTWVYDWQITQELLDYAITKSVDKVQPMQFLNKLLSIYHTKNITTVKQAESEKIEFVSNNYTKSAPKTNARSSAKREYSKEQLNSLFTSMEEVEI